MRDHTKLRAFELADSVALETYRVTLAFPSDERFGLVPQMRRAAVSTASNIVEGCARSTHRDYLRFLEIALASAKELRYQISLVRRLQLVEEHALKDPEHQSDELCRVLAGLIQSLRKREKS